MSDQNEAPWQQWTMDRIRENAGRVDVHVKIDGLAELGALFLKGFNKLEQEIQTMSQTLSQQIDAATAAIVADVSAVSAEVGRLLASLSPGSQVTQAQVDALTAIDTSLKAIPPSP
jgi:hypothetical protein